MADDIVTRLRIESASSVDVIRRLDMKCLCCPCCEESCLYCETVGEMAEAADEIERLRAELNNASAMANAYYELVQAYKWSHNHLGEWPDAIANLVAENYNLQKAVRDGLQP